MEPSPQRYIIISTMRAGKLGRSPLETTAPPITRQRRALTRHAFSILSALHTRWKRKREKEGEEGREGERERVRESGMRPKKGRRKGGDIRAQAFSSVITQVQRPAGMPGHRLQTAVLNRGRRSHRCDGSLPFGDGVLCAGVRHGTLLRWNARDRALDMCRCPRGYTYPRGGVASRNARGILPPSSQCVYIEMYRESLSLSLFARDTVFDIRIYVGKF